MLRQGPLPHPATRLRQSLAVPDLSVPQFSDLFMLLIQMGIAPDVTFIRYPVVNHYADMDEAMTDCRMLMGDEWDEARARTLVGETATKDGDELVISGGTAGSGIAHWHPAT